MRLILWCLDASFVLATLVSAELRAETSTTDAIAEYHAMFGDENPAVRVNGHR